jgi:hypothetical protein
LQPRNHIGRRRPRWRTISHSVIRQYLPGMPGKDLCSDALTGFDKTREVIVYAR